MWYEGVYGSRNACKRRTSHTLNGWVFEWFPQFFVSTASLAE